MKNQAMKNQIYKEKVNKYYDQRKTAEIEQYAKFKQLLNKEEQEFKSRLPSESNMSA
jgi:hypothetical protein